jgi:hypothetical protein
MLNPHPQLAPYQQSHDAEGTINPSEKLVARGNSGSRAPPTIKVGSELRARKTKRAAPARRINQKQANYFL